MKGESLTLAFVVLVVGVRAAAPALAQTEDVDDFPLPFNGNVQAIKFEGGEGENAVLDGIVVSVAFGGPERLPPPDLTGIPKGVDINFDELFVLEENGDQAFFRVADAFQGANDVLPLNGDARTAALDGHWVYAYAVFNDEGIDAPAEGGAFAQVGVKLSSSLINALGANAIIQTPGGPPGLYISGFGETDNIPGGKVNASNLQVNVLDEFQADYPLKEGSNSEVFYFYSPFAPSNDNSSIRGASGARGSASATLTNRFHTPRFWPEFTCEFADLPVTPPEPGDPITIRLDVTNETQSLGEILEPPVVGPPDEGFELRNLSDAGPFPSDNVMLDVKSNDCITIDAVRAGIAGGVTDTIALIERGTTEDFFVDITIDGDICESMACDTIIDVFNELVALAPYDKDPPFEGDPEPPIDPDPTMTEGEGEDEITFSCKETFEVQCPCIQSIDKKFLFVPDGDPFDCVAFGGEDPEDAPTCARVRVIITVRAEDASEPMTIDTLKDILPPELEFCPGTIESDPSGVTGVFDPGENRIDFNVPGSITLEPGETLVVCYETRVSPTASGGDTVGAGLNACSTASCGGTPAEPEVAMDDAILNIKKPAIDVTGPGGAPPVLCPISGGNMATLTFTVTNTSNAANGWPLDPVTVSARTTCGNLDIVSVTPGGGGANIGPLDNGGGPGSSVDVDVTVMLNGPCDPLVDVCLEAVGFPEDVSPTDDGCGIDSDRCDFDDEACAQVEAVVPDFEVECAPSVTTAQIGDPVDFVFTIENTGNVDLTNLVLSGCVLDPGLRDDGMTGFSPATIGPGETATATISTTVLELAPELCVRGCNVGAEPVGNAACRIDEDLPKCCIVTVEIPTLTEWGLILLVVALGGVMLLRRRP